MPDRHVQFHRLALKEYLHERRWYARRSAQAAARFVLAVDAAVQRIAENPLACPELRDGVRWVRLRRFPHLLYFLELTDNVIEIVAVAHGLRRLGYWIRRLKRR
ncbi:MAG: type II toxin-antitoxin system RelE/ParE family toxin [Planctomycetes bacterium]|nr:type II toxin-antitoxin system RelE/ParE family toxin [Planctomycetota bacterium]